MTSLSACLSEGYFATGLQKLKGCPAQSSTIRVRWWGVMEHATVEPHFLTCERRQKHHGKQGVSGGQLESSEREEGKGEEESKRESGTNSLNSCGGGSVLEHDPQLGERSVNLEEVLEEGLLGVEHADAL